MMKRFIVALTAMLLVGCGNNNQVPNAPNTNVLPSEPITNGNQTNTNAPENQQSQQNLNNPEENTSQDVTNNAGQTSTNGSNTNAASQNNQAAENQVTENPTTSNDTSTQEKPNTNQTVAQQTYEKITEGIALNDVTMGTELFRDTYGIDPALLSSYVVCMPVDSTEPTEIAIFELNNETSSDTVKLSIENRIQALNEQLGEQNFQIAEKNNVIVFIMSPQAEKMIQNFAKE